MGTTEDIHKHLGLFFLGLFQRKYLNQVNWEIFKSGLISWFIRGFFLPMNFCTAVFLLDKIQNIPNFTSFIVKAPLIISYPVINDTIFLLLIIAIVPGYFFTSRLLGTEGRSVSRDWPAWIFTLWFYPPLNSVLNNSYFQYTQSIKEGVENWIHFTEGKPIFFYSAAFILISMSVIHYWGEAILGMRASINTNKGIITNGPYRYTKHPIFVVKNIAWLIAFLPFLSGTNLTQSFKFTIAFVIVSIGYIMRCYFEEKFLSEDPTYVQYALYIDRHGLLSFIGKILPFMSFKWRYDRWTRLNLIKTK
jgi:protein-S-isoprenylcysteine O-methyltransferase Ste14